ncbi:MAG: NAD(P)-binding domain-containing protein [Muribaculaceae bacterium]|nr:NAD(P)-binding domain-containing protein [Muribaculaceae bacterium]
MKIALIGYGKMGHAIERAAIARGHEVVAIVDRDTDIKIDSPQFRAADAAIEFTMPAAAEANVREALKQGVPVVSGTTAWGEGLERIKSELNGEQALIWSGNYSLGVNIFFAVNRYLAKIMARFPQYQPDITETHHVHKLDHPSGTALMTAEQIIDTMPSLTGWSEEPQEGKLLINHIRHAEVPGIHTVTWESDVDTLTLGHSAKSRDGFALGAVLAAEWIVGKPGYHTIDEMMSQILGV